MEHHISDTQYFFREVIGTTVQAPVIYDAARPGKNILCNHRRVTVKNRV